MNSFKAKVEDSKQKLQEAGILGSTVSIMEGGADRSMVVVMSKQYGRGSQVIYEYLGMKAPEILQQKLIPRAIWAVTPYPSKCWPTTAGIISSAPPMMVWLI
ncbi:hypothetical protein ACFTAO_26440 [Paenibacillus rhizoplanae]